MESKDDKDSFNKKYIIKSKKGFGGTAKAFLVYEKSSKKTYVAKLVPLKKKDFFEKEVEALTQLNKENNPNIIRLIDSGIGLFDVSDNKKEEKYYIILEYAHNRELYDYIVYGGFGLGELFGKLLFSKILNGMKTVHELELCHKDLSLSNIFLDINYNPKIGDFGASMRNRPNIDHYFGTLEYEAPEIIKNVPYNGIKADIFSLGAILIFMVYGKKGFKKATASDKMYSLIMDEKNKKNIALYWEKMGLCLGEKISDEFKQLYIKMVSPDPEKRPDIETILKEYSWMTSINYMDIKQLSNSLKEKLKSIKNIVETFVTLEIKENEDKKKVGKYYTRGGADVEKRFNSNLKPKEFPDNLDMEFCIKILDYFAANQLMNSLYEKIDKKLGDNCLIQINKEKYKMILNFEKEDDDDSNNNEYDIMKIKLYHFEKGLILKLFKKEGNKENFFDKFKIICGLVKEILN